MLVGFSPAGMSIPLLLSTLRFLQGYIISGSSTMPGVSDVMPRWKLLVF